MEDFLKYIIPFLIDNKEAFQIDKEVPTSRPDASGVRDSDQSVGKEDQGTVIFTIHVAKEDMGKVIGKEGRTIQSIRNLVKILAVKENKRVMVEIAEPEGSEIPEEPQEESTKKE